MCGKIRRSAAIFSVIILAGLAGAYAASSTADALDLGALPRATSATQLVAGIPVVADEEIVREDLRKLARQAMNDLIASGRHAQN
jgi:hypothetical protein